MDINNVLDGMDYELTPATVSEEELKAAIEKGKRLLASGQGADMEKTIGILLKLWDEGYKRYKDIK